MPWEGSPIDTSLHYPFPIGWVSKLSVHHAAQCMQSPYYYVYRIPIAHLQIRTISTGCLFLHPQKPKIYSPFCDLGLHCGLIEGVSAKLCITTLRNKWLKFGININCHSYMKVQSTIQSVIYFCNNKQFTGRPTAKRLFGKNVTYPLFH